MKLTAFFLTPLLFAFNSLNLGTVNYDPSQATGARELTDVEGVAYAKNLVDWKGKRVDSLQFNLFYPTGASSKQKYPLVVICHGGGFSGGNRFNVTALCDRLADEGFATVGFDYRTGYNNGGDLPNCTADSISMKNAIYRAIQDVNACIRFLVANSEKYNIDTSKIFLGGSSAGATLALNAAYIDDSTAKIYFKEQFNLLGGPQSSGGNVTAAYTLKGIVDMWGSVVSNQLINTNYRAYPTIIFKGEEDGGTPDSAGHMFECSNYPVVYAGIAIYDRLQQQNVSSIFHFLQNANHPAYDEQFCAQESACFLNAIIKRGKTKSGQFSGYESGCN